MAPGVYLMKDASGKILYVGKAKNLRRRLASYFLKSGPADIKTRTLLRRVIDFDTIVTGSEKEALLLESNLIKRHRPRYNVILKDDKRYPVLRIDLKSEEGKALDKEFEAVCTCSHSALYESEQTMAPE